jgi:hypothetical protein
VEIQALQNLCVTRTAGLLNSDDLLLATDAFATLFNVMVKCYNEMRGFHDQVIECLWDANIRFPYSPCLSFFSWPAPLLALLGKIFCE